MTSMRGLSWREAADLSKADPENAESIIGFIERSTHEATRKGRNEELLKIAQTAYQEGEAGILELLDVFRLRRQSQQRLIELGTAAREAHIELERVMGREVTK